MPEPQSHPIPGGQRGLMPAYSWRQTKALNKQLAYFFMYKLFAAILNTRSESLILIINHFYIATLGPEKKPIL